MNEQVINEQTNKAAFKITQEDTVKMLQTYQSNADNSLTQIKANIDNALNQIEEWKRMMLMIVGQKQLIQDILNKTISTPEPNPAATSTSEVQSQTEPK